MPMSGLMVPPSSQEVKYLFVDGGCLWRELEICKKRYFGDQEPELDFARIRGDHRKVFFYDAIPVREHTETATDHEDRVRVKTASLEDIARKDAYHVRTGDAHRRRGAGREQKMVDVQLTVDMMSLAHRGVFSRATLLTGDLDFKPLVDALVAMGVDLHLLYPPKATNQELIASADTALPIDIEMILSWLNPSFVASLGLPTAELVLLEDQPGGELVHSWEDTLYGRCTITRNGPGYLVYTSRPFQGAPYQKLALRLRSWSENREYLEDRYKLRIPI